MPEILPDAQPQYQHPPQPAELLGAVLCGCSALGYSLANICIRQLSTYDLDQAFLVAGKETITVIVLLPWFLWVLLRRRELFRHKQLIGLMLGVAMLVQVVGNLNQIYCYGTIGLTIAIPIIISAMLMTSVWLGRLVLGEQVHLRSWTAIGMLIVSIVMICIVGQQNFDENIPNRIGTLLAGVTAALVVGVVYGTFSLAIRYTTTAGLSRGLVMIITCGVGMISLSGIGIVRSGLDQLQSMPWNVWGWIGAAGVFNFIAFICLTTGLSLTRVVRANLLNASQVALSAIGGILFFSEPSNEWLWLGIALTIGGVMMIGGSGEE